jgi:uncharacterized membrane protein
MDHQHDAEAAPRRRGLAEPAASHNTPRTPDSSPHVIDGSGIHDMDYHLHDSGGADYDREGTDTDHDQHHQPSLLLLQQETHTRSILKGFTWRIIATTTTTAIAWLVTGHLEAAFQIGFFEFFAKLFLYYMHERVWNGIRL